MNEKWFVNKTSTEFPDDIKWLLSLGPKFGLPTQKDDFPLFKYIADGENLIQTHTNKEQQERARTKFATSLENHLNKMNLNGRDRFVSNTVDRTRKFLKTHKNISILNADKGNVTVAMEKRDYKDRMQKIVGDIMSYQRLNKDPTQGLQKKNNEIVDELFKNNIISESEKRRMKTEIATAPRLYGVPKIHKDNFPLRPICSSVNAPSAAMSKFLVNILKKLTTGSKYNIKDSVQFRNKIKDMTIKHDEKLISFDVVSLFPSVPVEYNNFPPIIIKKLITNYKPSSEQTDDNKDPKSYKSLTYIPTISERIAKSDIFDTNKYNLAHKSNNTLKNLFTNTKDNIPLSETPNVIYEIPCDGKSKEKCQMIYIGTTKNKLKTRLSGHKSDIKIRNNNSKLQKTALATHCAATNHQPNFDRVRVLQRESNTSKRYTLEMLHINNVPTTRRINYKTDTDNIAHIYRQMICRNDGKKNNAQVT
ncbi:uncharacterized protein LOC142224982 [Haematobia irritans]|uniref:uncharacterized protein LOC142224982 n=1 Tax=Haematobia irritans TaxID=7368 RepID=UPI003F4FCBEF